jgi:hypothetical protein
MPLSCRWSSSFTAKLIKIRHETLYFVKHTFLMISSSPLQGIGESPVPTSAVHLFLGRPTYLLSNDI